MSSDTLQCVEAMLREFRKLVVDVHEDNRLLKRHLAQPLTTNHHHQPTTTFAAAGNNHPSTTSRCNTSSEPSSNLAANGTAQSNSLLSSSNTVTTGPTLKPPPYKSALRLSSLEEPPRPPVRTRRRNASSQTAASTQTETTYSATSNTLPSSGTVNGLAPHNLIKKTVTLSKMSSSMAGATAGRGALIVFEGLDRVGKSTLAKRLMDHLEKTKKPVIYQRFPDRTTPVGKLIDEYLQNGARKLPPRALHLLFSANRWELSRQVRSVIQSGTTVIVDRYAYSGIAYSSAQKEASLELCLQAEKGLPRPDLVIYLELPRESQFSRQGFGDERLETKEIQDLVRLQYQRVMDLSQETWLRVDVSNKSPDTLLGEIILPVRRCLEACVKKELGDLDFLPY